MKNSSQNSIFFQNNIPEIKGLFYVPEYINKREEKNLLQKIESQNWLLDLKRRVQHYGYKYDYVAKKVTIEMKLGPIPKWLNEYSLRLVKQNYFPEEPDQIIINEYEPGQGISTHIDCIPCFGEKIASLSLGSNCIMEFFNTKTKERNQILLERRSLIVFSEDARYIWQHSIPARKSDKYNRINYNRTKRISLTFRNVIIN